jgi:hypothetical protein
MATDELKTASTTEFRMDARRMLLIGLGTTGACVCNQVLDRITWNYGSPESVPWLQTIVLETQGAQADRRVNMHARYLHLTVNADDFRQLQRNPQAYEATLNLPSWQVHGVAEGADSITDGAKNIRYLGRLAFFHLGNFSRIRTQITANRDALKSLSAAQAAVVFGEAAGKTVALQLPESVHIYVVGTLCGGTASGAFIDLGYLLTHIVADASTTGIFALPSSDHSNEREVANAVAALRELNHYSSNRSRYTCQYPDTPGSPKVLDAGTRPYKHLYLIQSRDGSPKAEYARLLTSVADYVYADLLGSSANTRDSDRTNITEYFDKPDYAGATQKYFSFGTAVIEYPYAKVAKACRLRFALRGMRHLSGGGLQPEARSLAVRTDVPLIEPNALRQRLYRHNHEPLSGSIRAIIGQCRDMARASDDPMDLLLEQLKAAFDGTGQAEHKDLPRNLVPLTLEGNAAGTEAELRDAIKTVLRQALPDGAGSAVDVADELAKQLKQRIEEQKRQSGRTSRDLLEEAELSRERAADCRKDWALFCTGARAQAVLIYVDDFIRTVGEYADQRLTEAASKAVEDTYANTLRWVETVQARLTDSSRGLEREIGSYVAKIAAMEGRSNTAAANEEDPWSRRVSGLELFDEHTVDREYEACIKSEAQRLALGASVEGAELVLAKKVVAPYVEDAIQALLSESTATVRFDRSAGDKAREITDDDVLDLAEPASAHLSILKSRTVLDHLFIRGDAQKQIEEALKQSGILLDWNDASPRYDSSNPEKKAYGYVFYDTYAESAPKLVTALKAPVVTQSPKRVPWADPFQVLFLQERGAFSLATVRPLGGDETRWSVHFRQEHPERLISRGDVGEWIGWEESDEQDRRVSRNVFLISIALNLTEFVAVTRYHYRYRPLDPIDPGYVELSNDLYEAVETIRGRGILPQLQQGIWNWRNANSDAELITRLAAFVRGTEQEHPAPMPGIDGRFREGARSLTTRDVWSYLLGYILADAGLKEASERTEWGQVSVEQYELLRGKPPVHDADWYYCPACGVKLGRNPEDLFINRGGKLVAICLACNKPLPLTVR